MNATQQHDHNHGRAIRNTTPNIGKFNAARALMHNMHVSVAIVDMPERKMKLAGGHEVVLPAGRVAAYPGKTYSPGRNFEKRERAKARRRWGTFLRAIQER